MLVLFVVVVFVVGAVALASVLVGTVSSSPMRYCAVSESSVDEDAPWRRPGAVGPEFDLHSGCFHGEYVVCVPYGDFEADAWDGGGDREFASTACPSADGAASAGGDAEGTPTVFCVVAPETAAARGGVLLGEIVRADAAGRCRAHEARVCGMFVPATAEHRPFDVDKTDAFRSASCP